MAVAHPASAKPRRSEKRRTQRARRFAFDRRAQASRRAESAMLTSSVFEPHERSDEDRYQSPAVPRYSDNLAEQSELRFKYEHGRQQLFAKGGAHNRPVNLRPMSSSQEMYLTEPAAAGYYPAPAAAADTVGWKSSALDVAQQLGPPDAAVSCATCRRCMSCSGPDRAQDVFCRHCNEHALLESAQSAAVEPSSFVPR